MVALEHMLWRHFLGGGRLQHTLNRSRDLASLQHCKET